MQTVTFVAVGEPASKANQRRLVTIRGRPAFIKSAKAIAYVSNFKIQCPKLKTLMEGLVRVDMVIYYASRRPDLDESVVLDAMEGRIYKNDRQVRERHTYWGLDKKNPRVVIRVSEIESVEVPDYLA